MERQGLRASEAENKRKVREQPERTCLFSFGSEKVLKVPG